MISLSLFVFHLIPCLNPSPSAPLQPICKVLYDLRWSVVLMWRLDGMEAYCILIWFQVFGIFHEIIILSLVLLFIHICELFWICIHKLAHICILSESLISHYLSVSFLRDYLCENWSWTSCLWLSMSVWKFRLKTMLILSYTLKVLTLLTMSYFCHLDNQWN